MLGSDFYSYVLETFVRTDKSAQVYEAMTDTVQELRRLVISQEAQKDIVTTATISVLGNYTIALESDFGIPVADIRILEANSSFVLRKLSKAAYDQRFPNPTDTTVPRSKPIYYSIYGNNIYLGPVPDKTTYQYEIVYAARAATIAAGTVSVPFTDLYREIVRWGVLFRLYDSLEQDDLASKNMGLYMKGIDQIIEREGRVGDGVQTIRYQDL